MSVKRWEEICHSDYYVFLLSFISHIFLSLTSVWLCFDLSPASRVMWRFFHHILKLSIISCGCNGRAVVCLRGTWTFNPVIFGLLLNTNRWLDWKCVLQMRYSHDCVSGFREGVSLTMNVYICRGNFSLASFFTFFFFFSTYLHHYFTNTPIDCAVLIFQRMQWKLSCSRQSCLFLFRRHCVSFNTSGWKSPPVWSFFFPAEIFCSIVSARFTHLHAHICARTLMEWLATGLGSHHSCHSGSTPLISQGAVAWLSWWNMRAGLYWPSLTLMGLKLTYKSIWIDDMQPSVEVTDANWMLQRCS